MAVRTPADSADTRIAYSYDELGRLSGVTVDKRNDENVTETTSYTYNAVGSLAKITYANGNYATYTYDSLNRLTNLVHKNSSNTTLASYAYTLAADGMRTGVTEANSTGNIATYTWAYDSMNRLIEEDYNDLVGSDDYNDIYVYNLVDNRLQKQIEGEPNTSYVYNDNDQLTSETTDSNSITYTYNTNGSLTYVAKDNDANHTYVYDYRNRMVQVSVESGNIVDYEYNPSGIRVNADVNNAGSMTYTDFLIDPYNHTGYAQVFKEIGDSNTIFVLGHDVIAQANGTSDPNYFVYDGHGSVRHLANNSGTIVESYNYDAYGNAHGFSPGNAATNLLYTGEWYDSDATQYYLRARWYSPANGRFNRMDPFAGNSQDPQSLHKYLYVHNNPINAIDPTGNFGFSLIGLGTLTKPNN